MSRCGSVGCLFVKLGVSVTRYNVCVHVFLRCMRVRKKCGVFFFRWVELSASSGLSSLVFLFNTTPFLSLHEFVTVVK